MTIATPTPYTPADGHIARDATPMLSWSPVAGALTYEIEVSTDPTFVSGVIQFTVSQSEAQRGQAFGQTYYWRVRAKSVSETSAFSLSRAFSVPPFIPVPDSDHDTEGRGRMLEQFKETA